MNAIRSGFFAVACLFIAGGAYAEGVTDFAIDPAVTYNITIPGSYRLAGDATMTEDAVGINVDADDVTLDLNGHTITGLPGGSNAAIEVLARNRLTVRNGAIRQWGGHGIFVFGDDTNLTDLTIEGCGETGAVLLLAARVTNVRARNNGRYGISAGQSSCVENCVAIGNNRVGSLAGISVGVNSIVRGCTANSNSPLDGDESAVGIRAASGSLVEQCVANANAGSGSGAGIGIQADSQCNLIGNTCNKNAGGLTNFLSAGISTGADCVVRDNNCSQNTAGVGIFSDSYGIRASTFNLIEGNLCNFNTAPGLDGNGTGILAGVYSSVNSNTASHNGGIGEGGSTGISVMGSCRVENNQCALNSGGTFGYGILADEFSSDNFLRANRTTENASAGIRLGAAGNRAQENAAAELVGISDVGGNSLGVGDLANVAY